MGWQKLGLNSALWWTTIGSTIWHRGTWEPRYSCTLEPRNLRGAVQTEQLFGSLPSSLDSWADTKELLLELNV